MSQGPTGTSPAEKNWRKLCKKEARETEELSCALQTEVLFDFRTGL